MTWKSQLTSHFHACSFPQDSIHPSTTEPQIFLGVAVARPYLQQQGDGDASRAHTHGTEAGDDEGPPAHPLNCEALPGESRHWQGVGELQGAWDHPWNSDPAKGGRKLPVGDWGNPSSEFQGWGWGMESARGEHAWVGRWVLQSRG